MKNPSRTRPSTALLFDQVKSLLNVKSDRALAERLDQSTTSICRMRSEQRPLNPQTIISIHEETRLPIYAIRLLAGIQKLPEPPRELCNFIEKSPHYDLIKSAGFCFCVETNEFSCSNTNETGYYYLVAIAQCTGYRPIVGEFYPATEHELEEMKQPGIEASAMHCLDDVHFFDHYYFLQALKDLAAITAQMIAECPRFYAVKAEHEADILAATIAQKPAQPSTTPQRGRL